MSDDCLLLKGDFIDQVIDGFSSDVCRLWLNVKAYMQTRVDSGEFPFSYIVHKNPAIGKLQNIDFQI